MKSECEYCYPNKECEDLPIGRIMTLNSDEDPYLTIRPLSVETCVKVKNLLATIFNKLKR